ncbi:Superkiller protein 3, partial [Kickxella alabastrina]
MSVIFKAKLKNAKTAINDKDYSYSYDLCHDLLELDSTNYNAHILLGVSCQHLQKWNEGTAVYRKAQALGKANILAWQGLCALHEAEGNDQELVRSLGSLRDRYLNQEDDLEKAWETHQKIIALAEKSGSQRQVVAELRLLTEDSGPLHRLLLAGNAQDIMTERE